VGDLAPDFNTDTLDGKPLRLADYRGKFVLLDFRYNLPGNEIKNVRSVNDSFGKDARFVTITLCQSVNDDYVKELKSGANHWVMGELDFSTMNKPYGLTRPMPLIILVGPDGKILASGLEGDSIYASVAKALK
jgi:peroxiredoxin